MSDPTPTHDSLRHRPHLWGAAVMCALGALLVLATTANARPSPRSWRPIPLNDWVEPARPGSGGKDAIILMEEGEVHDGLGKYEYSVFRRLKVFTDEGRSVANVDIDYAAKNTKIAFVRARSVRPTGVATELEPSQVIHTTLYKARGVEWRRASFIVPGVEVGSIVEYQYAIEGKYWGAWFFPWRFQNAHYTLWSRFTWETSDWERSEGFTPTWVLRNIPDALVETSCNPNCDKARRVSLAARALVGIRNEVLAPPGDISGPYALAFYRLPKYDAFGYWTLWKQAYELLLADYEKSLGPLAKIIDQARARYGDSEAGLTAIHRWLQTNVRATDTGRAPRLSTREGASVARLIARGSGHPFELSAALAVAARRLGFDACVVMVRDRRDGAFDHRVFGAPPSHAVTAVRLPGRKWTYYAPASRFASAGNVPWNLRGGYGLIVGSKHGLFAQLSPDEGEAGQTHWSLRVQLDNQGHASGELTARLRGEAAREWKERLWSEPEDRWPHVLAEELVGDVDATIEFEPPTVLGHPGSDLTLRGRIAVDGVGSVAAGLVTLRLEKLCGWRLCPELPLGSRQQPVFLKYGRDEQFELTLQLPGGASVETLPSVGTFENDVGLWETKWVMSPLEIRMSRWVQVASAQISPSKYDDVRALFDSLEEADHQVVLVRTP